MVWIVHSYINLIKDGLGWESFKASDKMSKSMEQLRLKSFHTNIYVYTLYVCIKHKGTISINSSGLLCKDCNARLSTIPLKPISVQ